MLSEILHKVAGFEAEEDHPYHPRPSLSGPQRCIRSLDYYRQGYEKKPFPGRFVVVLEDSTIHEMLVKDLIQKSAFQVHSEQMKVTCATVDGKPMTGSIDGIVTDILGVDRLLEIKALSHFGFLDIWNGHLPVDYIYQTSLYARGLHEFNPETHEAILLVKNKNQGQFCEIQLEYDFNNDSTLVKKMILSTGEERVINETINNVVSSTVARFEEIERYAQEKKLHDRQYERDNWHCMYCQFGEQCWSTWEEEFEERVDSITLPTEVQNDLATAARYYKQKGAEVTEMEKEKDALSNNIKATMKFYNCKTTEVEEYRISVKLQSRAGIDKEKIPPVILAEAATKSTFEVLRVDKRKSK